jgi:hypothetical protein
MDNYVPTGILVNDDDDDEVVKWAISDRYTEWNDM